MNLHTYGQLIFDKGAKTIQWKKAFSSNGAGSTGSYYVEKYTSLSLCAKLKSKWIKDLHIKPRLIDTNRRESGEEPQTHWHRGNFSHENTNGLCSKINKWGLIKLESF